MKLMYNMGKETALIASRVAEAPSPTAIYISETMKAMLYRPNSLSIV